MKALKQGNKMPENSFKQTASNINLLWASLFIEELIRLGVSDFCIAPGSRSTPLTLAVANHPKTNKHLHFDERGLGFFALGLSRASSKPVVIITTSGSAVANLYPAVVEAKQSRIPLIIISADRPAELINCGANQAIEQDNIFANYPCFFTQIPTATIDISPAFLLTTIDHGLAKQKQCSEPIHFNIAFTDPFYPTNTDIDYHSYLSALKKWPSSNLPYTQYIQAEKIEVIKEHPLKNKKVIFIIGRLKTNSNTQTLSEYASQHHIPLLCDIQSSSVSLSNNIAYYDLCLLRDDFSLALSKADVIVQFGEQLISKRLSQFIERFTGEYWLVNEGNTRIDPNHTVTKRFEYDIETWINTYLSSKNAMHKYCSEELLSLSKKLEDNIVTPYFEKHQFNEINIARSLDKLLPDHSPLFIGNSMPVRLADMFMHSNYSKIFTNRGASGIDGLLATAVGIAKHSKQPMTLLIGDTSFLYDLNSLALLKQLECPFVIILLNNDGGSIFNLLPVPAQQKQDYYQLPHGYTFKPTCDQFGLQYYQPTSIETFEENYQSAIKQGSSLIEICIENSQSHEQLNQIKQLIQDASF